MKGVRGKVRGPRKGYGSPRSGVNGVNHFLDVKKVPKRNRFKLCKVFVKTKVPIMPKDLTMQKLSKHIQKHFEEFREYVERYTKPDVELPDGTMFDLKVTSESTGKGVTTAYARMYGVPPEDLCKKC